MFEWAYPWALTGLAAVPVLYWYLAHRKRMPAIEVISLEAFRAVPRRSWRRRLLPGLAALTLAVLVVALARPRWGNDEVVIRSEGIDMVFAIDLSGSMEAIDVPRGVTTMEALDKALKDGTAIPRIEAAKREVARFIEERPSDRIGLIGFADLAYTLSPPTLDSGFLLDIIANLQVGMLGQSTGIAAPLITGVKRLADSDAPRRVLVLFTDGSNNIENRLTPEQAAELAKAKDVVIYTVGIGSPNAVIFQESLFGGRQLVSYSGNFDEQLLRNIARIAGGRYFHAADAAGLETVMSEINQLEKTSFEQPKYIEYQEFAPTLALIALGLLLLAFTLECTTELRIP